MRKVIRAARTEGDLEGDRLQGALAQELQAAKARAAASQHPQLAAVQEPAAPPPAVAVAPRAPSEAEDPLEGADLRGAAPEHLPVIAALVAERETQLRALHVGPSDVARRVEVLWIRSNATHAAWCERRHAATLAARAMTREVICVVQIDRGQVVERWFFG